MKTVLIIDDDARYRRLVAEPLEAQGWRILEAGNGQAGLEDVRTHRPEVVLCDLLMPGGNGFGVCRGIRADPALRHIKIVITSGRDFAEDRLAAREAGADEYLTKPFPPQAHCAWSEAIYPVISMWVSSQGAPRLPMPESLEAYKKAGISPRRVITGRGKIGERHLRPD